MGKSARLPTNKSKQRRWTQEAAAEAGRMNMAAMLLSCGGMRFDAIRCDTIRYGAMRCCSAAGRARCEEADRGEA